MEKSKRGGKRTQGISDVSKRYTYMTDEDAKILTNKSFGYFQTGNSWDINECLRGEKIMTEKRLETIEVLDKNMRPINKEMVVVRMADRDYTESLGVDLTIDSIESIKTKLIGGIVEEKGFMSTSYDIGENVFKYREVRLVMKLPKGTKGMFSPTGQEAEFLLARGTKYKINNVIDTGEKTFMGVPKIEMHVEIVR